MRRRLGVVLLLDEPWRSEVQGLRRALRSPSLETQPPHLTLVPPVNVPESRLDDAVAVLRREAARCRPTLRLTIGPVASFAPVSPVIYLRVDGDDLEELHRLQAGVFRGPLLRSVDYDYVPHVTVHESAPIEAISGALSALTGFRVDVEFDRVHLLEQGPDRLWRPLTDVAFGPSTVRGRGGVELHLRWSHLPAPDVRSLFERHGEWLDSPESAGRTAWLEARDSQDELIGARLGDHAVMVDGSLGYGIEERLLNEPAPRSRASQ